MADFNLTDLIEGTTIEPWEVVYDEKNGKEQVAYFKHILGLRSGRDAFWKFVMDAGQAFNGEPSEEVITAAVDEYDSDVETYLADRTREVFKELSTNAKSFEALARRIDKTDNRFVHWFGLLSQYCDHYNILEERGESKPSQTS